MDSKFVHKFTPLEIGCLAHVFTKSVLTILKWIESGDDRMTSDKAKRAIKKAREFETSMESI